MCPGLPEILYGYKLNLIYVEIIQIKYIVVGKVRAFHLKLTGVNYAGQYAQ